MSTKESDQGYIDETARSEATKPQNLKTEQSASPVTNVYIRDSAKPRPWGARIGCYVWYALNILLICCAYFPILPHSTIIIDEDECEGLRNKTIKLFEDLSPGSTKPLLSMIPDNWRPTLTRYEFFFDDICRKRDGHERICYGAEGEKMTIGIIKDMGYQFAEDTNNPSISSNWSKAFHSALEAANQEIGPYLICRNVSGASTGFTGLVYSESLTGSTRGWIVTNFVFFLLHLLCDTTSYFGAVKYDLLAKLRTLCFAIQIIAWFILFLMECFRYILDLLPILNIPVKHGQLYHLVILCFVWHFVNYVSLVWYYGPTEWLDGMYEELE